MNERKAWVIYCPEIDTEFYRNPIVVNYPDETPDSWEKVLRKNLLRPYVKAKTKISYIAVLNLDASYDSRDLKDSENFPIVGSVNIEQTIIQALLNGVGK